MQRIATILIALEMGMLSYVAVSATGFTTQTQRIHKTPQIKRPFVKLDRDKARDLFINETKAHMIESYMIDTEMLSSLSRGDICMIEGLEKHSYLLRLTQKHYFKNSISLRFECLLKQHPCHAAITIGTTNTYMLLHTVQEEYEMEARNDVAYFYTK